MTMMPSGPMSTGPATMPGAGPAGPATMPGAGPAAPNPARMQARAVVEQLISLASSGQVQEALALAQRVPPEVEQAMLPEEVQMVQQAMQQAMLAGSVGAGPAPGATGPMPPGPLPPGAEGLLTGAPGAPGAPPSASGTRGLLYP